MYCLARNLIFFALPPEAAHRMAMTTLALRLKQQGLMPPLVKGERQVMGLHFSNPVGLAAGMDKNAEYVDALGNLGFGFIEVGGVTPLPQAGNPKPRVFRLPKARALINRMGFNNIGVAGVARNLSRRKYQGIVGINIGKNATTSDEHVTDDYTQCLEGLYEQGDFFTINVSSPNTPNLRDWQHGERLKNLLAAVIGKRDELAKIYHRTAPIAVKISPDLDTTALQYLAATVADAGCDGVVACNTTLSRPPAITVLPHAGEAGGLSGVPLAERSTQVIEALRGLLPDHIAIIGVGGIFSPDDAKQKLSAGADLIQIYTGLIYEGPTLPAKIIDQLAN